MRLAAFYRAYNYIYGGFMELHGLLDTISRIKEDSRSLKEQMSSVDREIVVLYHELELLTGDAVSLVRVGSKLRKALRLRRELKNKNRYYQSILSLGIDKYITNISKNIERDMARYAKETLDNIC
jgi:hypothetical protein